mmetsp:Transcript_3804/g.7021  ORF Transcript_3804/g.7021 Transcript_3804/m.7021 type:complete len:208 (-) Transcript_3804:370-993(-)
MDLESRHVYSHCQRGQDQHDLAELRHNLQLLPLAVLRESSSLIRWDLLEGMLRRRQLLCMQMFVLFEHLERHDVRDEASRVMPIDLQPATVVLNHKRQYRTLVEKWNAIWLEQLPKCWLQVSESQVTLSRPLDQKNWIHHQEESRYRLPREQRECYRGLQHERAAQPRQAFVYSGHSYMAVAVWQVLECQATCGLFSLLSNRSSCPR